MKFVWEKCKAYHQTIFITLFNKYQGLVLFLMLLAIYFK
jgi:hypothetical protein